MVPTATSASASIDDVLSALDIEIRAQSRFKMAARERFELEPGHITMIYAIEGELRITGGARFSWDTDAECLSPGDVLLASGSAPVVVESLDGASVMLSILDLAEQSAHLAALLPVSARISGFAALEPAAAALTLHLGAEVRSLTDADGQCPVREGDRIVCRMMARTVLLSVIRAWWRRGCAPQGWPSLSLPRDPFLDRVAAAVVEDPGRNWSLESLSAVGAMSRSVFSERFRAAFGDSPAEYVAGVRMRVAKDLLGQGRQVSEVARELGYRSDEGFSRAFRRHTGVTPSAWRSRSDKAGARQASARPETRVDAPNSTAPMASTTAPQR